MSVVGITFNTFPLQREFEVILDLNDLYTSPADCSKVNVQFEVNHRPHIHLGLTCDLYLDQDKHMITMMQVYTLHHIWLSVSASCTSLHFGHRS